MEMLKALKKGNNVLSCLEVVVVAVYFGTSQDFSL